MGWDAIHSFSSEVILHSLQSHTNRLCTRCSGSMNGKCLGHGGWSTPPDELMMKTSSRPYLRSLYYSGLYYRDVDVLYKRKAE